MMVRSGTGYFVCTAWHLVIIHYNIMSLIDGGGDIELIQGSGYELSIRLAWKCFTRHENGVNRVAHILFVCVSCFFPSKISSITLHDTLHRLRIVCAQVGCCSLSWTANYTPETDFDFCPRQHKAYFSTGTVYSDLAWSLAADTLRWLNSCKHRGWWRCNSQLDCF